MSLKFESFVVDELGFFFQILQELFYVRVPVYKNHSSFTAKKDRPIVYENHPCILPHELVHAMYRAGNKHFAGVMGTPTNAAEYWNHWLHRVGADWAKQHCAGPCHSNNEVIYPVGLHGDDVKFRSAGHFL
jgi:hypothetical protein